MFLFCRKPPCLSLQRSSFVQSSRPLFTYTFCGLYRSFPHPSFSVPYSQPPPHEGSRSRSKARPRTSWRLPNVLMPGGRAHISTTLASLDAQLGRRNDPIHRAGPILSHHQLGGYQVGSSNAAGQLALLKSAVQDPLFTPPHRRPGYSSNQQQYVSRPGGLPSRLVDGDGMGGNSLNITDNPHHRGGGSSAAGARRGSAVALWDFESPRDRRLRMKRGGGDRHSRVVTGAGPHTTKKLNIHAFRQWYKDS